MSNICLDLSGKLSSDAIGLYRDIDQVCRETGLSFLVVGATARDLVLHYGYQLPISRLTRDVDFAVQVENWVAFESLRNSLLSRGYRGSATLHRLVSPTNIPIDLVPFGGIEREDATTLLPPNFDTQMNMLGFAEAFDQAQSVVIDQSPRLEISVPTAEGLMLLKLISWTDRALELRNKDATDIHYLLGSYSALPYVEAEIYAHMDLLDRYDGDPEMVAAHLYGGAVSCIVANRTRAYVSRLFQDELPERSRDRLCIEMTRPTPHRYETASGWLEAFIEGWRGMAGSADG